MARVSTASEPMGPRRVTDSVYILEPFVAIIRVLGGYLGSIDHRVQHIH
jgi:hypothetical protein